MTALAVLGLANLLWQTPVPSRPTVGCLFARFSYQIEGAPQGCPTAAQLQREIQAGLDHDPFRVDAPLLLAIRIVPRDPREGGGTAEVTLSDASGRLRGRQHIRTVNADCQALASSAALAARLALEPVVEGKVSAAPLDEHSTGVAVAVAPTSPELRQEATVGTKTPHASLDGVLSIGPLVGFGSGVSPSLGLMLGGELRWRHASLGLQVRADLPSSAVLEIYSSASLQTALLTAMLAPCARWGGFAGCALLALGRQESSGAGLDPNETLDSFYGAAGGRVAYDVRPWRGLGFALSADVLVPFARTQLLVSGQPVWQTPPVSVALWLAVETWVP